MIDLPLTEASPDWRPLVDALRAGDSVRLVIDGKPIGVASPVAESKAPPKQSYAEWAAEWRASLPPDLEGFSDEEVNSWRDPSPGREIDF